MGNRKIVIEECLHCRHMRLTGIFRMECTWPNTGVSHPLIRSSVPGKPIPGGGMGGIPDWCQLPVDNPSESYESAKKS